MAQLETRGVSIPGAADEGIDYAADLRINIGKRSNGGLESNIGEYGLAWLGNIVLFFGITFLVQYLQVSGYKYFSPVFGYAAVGGVFFLAYYLRNSNPYMAKIFDLTGYLLTFYVTLKLHYFNIDPVVTGKVMELVLMLAVCIAFLYVAIRRNYPTLAGLTLVLMGAAAVLNDHSVVMLIMATLISAISIVFLYRFGWFRMIFLAISLVYIINLIWLLNNPIMGHEAMIIKNHGSGFVYMILAAAIFSLIALMPEREELYTQVGIISAIVFNGIGFTFVVALFIISFFKDSYVAFTGSIALYCLVYSVILRKYSLWKITAAMYVLFGFVTLSVSIYGIYGFPRVFFLLAVQSLLVVSMAIWFRSKFIVIMNSILFLILLMVYLSVTDHGNDTNIAFSVVALATARILNWKKEMLTIRTEYIRNFYLITAFCMVLFTLEHIMADQYVALSWTVAAALYFAFSLILKNVKYRYMALATMVAAAFYLFIVDLAKIGLVYRVIALLFLSVISIGLSLYYTKKLRNREDEG